MLLVRTNALPEGESWLYEVKFDGYRAIAIKTRGQVRLRSRNETISIRDIHIRAFPPAIGTSYNHATGGHVYALAFAISAVRNVRVVGLG